MRTVLGRLLGPSVAAVLVIGAGAAPALAADDPKQSSLTWSVQPATATGLDRRPNVTVTVSPGQRVVDHVAVSNYGTEPLTLKLYATDAFNTDRGEFSLLPAAERPKDIGDWIELKKNKLTIPARSKTIVPFSIDVPLNATPGDHAGGVVASLTTGADAGDAGKVAVEQRAGTRIYARVLGEATAQLSVTDVSTTYEGSTAGLGDAVVTYTVRNTGNTRVAGERQVEVAGPFGAGRTAGPATALPELLPGEQATYTERLDGVAPLVRLTGTVTIAPTTVGSVGDPLPAVTGSASSWAVPWVLIAMVLLVAAIGGALVRRRLRRRSARAVAATAAPSAPSAHPNPEGARADQAVSR